PNLASLRHRPRGRCARVVAVVAPPGAHLHEASVGDRKGLGVARVGKPCGEVAVVVAPVVHPAGVGTAEPWRDVQARERPVAIHDAVTMRAGGPERMPRDALYAPLVA